MAYPRPPTSWVGHTSSHIAGPYSVPNAAHTPRLSCHEDLWQCLLFCFYSWTRLSFYQNNRGSKAPCVSGTRVSRISEPITTCPSNLYAA